MFYWAVWMLFWFFVLGPNDLYAKQSEFILYSTEFEFKTWKISLAFTHKQPCVSNLFVDVVAVFVMMVAAAAVVVVLLVFDIEKALFLSSSKVKHANSIICALPLKQS